MTRKIREKPEEFVGWKSEDGMLEVVALLEKSKNSKFKVVCHKCKEDKELFPLGYFVSTKSHLINGKIPCGCSKKPNWTQEQYLVLARRAAQGRFIVHGFSEEFHGAYTKLNLECLIDGNKWQARISKVINDGTGCHKCNIDCQRTDEQEALAKCTAICTIEGYKIIGFVEDYRNALKSRFEYFCPKHGKQNVSYNHFVNSGTRCKGCWIDRQKESGNGNGYYPERKDEQDFLYVLDFDNKFIKVGRSFDVERRLGKNELQKDSGISNIIKLRIFTATHKKIYDTEQEIHKQLRERGFQYYLEWTNECFKNDGLLILNKLLDNCNLKEIYI